MKIKLRERTSRLVLSFLLFVMMTCQAMFLPSTAEAAIAATQLTTANSTTGATSYTTASINPTGKNLVLAWVANYRSGGTATTPTMSGNGLTWTQVGTLYVSGVTTHRLTLFRAMATSPTSGSATISFGATAQTNVGWTIIQFSGVDTTGTNGSGAVVQSITSSAAATTSLTTTLAGFASNLNATAAGFMISANSALTAEAANGYANWGTNWTNGAVLSEFKGGVDSTPSATNGSNRSWAGIGVELRIANDLTVGNGTDPGATTAYISGSGYVADSFSMAMSTASSTVSTLTLTDSGTGSFTTDVSAIRVYRDAGTIGTLDGADTLVPTTYTATAGSATVTFATPENVTTTGGNYLVVLDIADGAAAGNTLVVKVTAATGTVGSPVYSDSTAPSLAVTTGNLTVGNSTNPGAANAYINSTNNAIDAFSMVVSAGYGKVTTLTLTTSTNFTSTNVSSINVYHDNGTTGTYDDGIDTLVPATFTIGVNTATITFTTPEYITSSAQNYIITVDIKSSAVTSNTLTAYVSAATGTGLGTKTFSDNTGYPTLTIASGNLTVSDTTNPSSVNPAYRGNEYPIDGFTLVVSAGVGKITSMVLTNTGTGQMSTHVNTAATGVKIYRDVAPLGTLDVNDVLVPTSSSIATNNATVTFTTPETVTTTPQSYLAIVDIANAATFGNTLIVKVNTTTSNLVGTGLGTKTINDTSSATLTVAQNNLTVGTGTNPSSVNVYKTLTYAVDGFTLQMSAANSTVAGLTLTTTNSAANNVSNIRIYSDAATVGTLDGSDTLIPTTLSGQAATSATITFTTPEPVLSASAKNYLIVYDIAEGATVGNTLTARVTSATGFVGVPTYNDTTYATLTIAQGTLAVATGTNPSNANVPQGSTDKAIDGFTLTMSAGATGKVSSLTLSNTNSTATNVSNIKLYNDAAAIGTLDVADTLIPSAYSISSATAATVDFDTPETVTASAKNYLIVYDIASEATVTNTLTSRVTAVSGIGLGTPTYNDTTNATLTVIAGICTRTAPSIAVETGSAQTYGQALAGFTKDYTITVTNNDNSYCSNSTFTVGLGSETGTTASFNIPSVLGATSTGVLVPGGKFSTSFIVSTKTTGSIADSITSTINVTDSTNHAAQSGSTTLKTYVNDPMMHNSISTGSTKWSGSWGVTGGQYGAFSCTTCHVPKTTNIARIKTSIAAPGGAVIFLSKASSNSFGVYSTTVSGSQQICETCHTNTTYHKGTMSSIVSHENEAQVRNCTLCHDHKRGFKPIGGCTSCHSYDQRNRVAVVNQLTGGQSHHIQGVPVTDKLCYQCHWEANSDGTVNLAKHGGSISTGQPVDLVVYQNGVRPTSSNVTTAIAYTANGTRTQLANINTHCLGCHNAGSAAAQPFADGKTPKQYAWDALSIDERYSQVGSTPWGKYSDTSTTDVTPKNNLTKAYSAHGKAGTNKRGWDLSETWPNTSGSVKVLCYDCHNSHGSSASGVTSNYSSATGKYKGAILKDTSAGKGGYTVSYKPQSGGSAGTKDAYNPGAGICFDCHNTQTSGTKPWGYSNTYGASQAIMGYWDTPYFSAGTFAPTQRYTYKGNNATNKGGHFGKSSDMNTTPTASINGLCTPCHDPHGVSPSLGSDQQYGVPLLKNTWLTSPYPEDAAPSATNEKRGGSTSRGPSSINVGSTPLYHIDQNTFAGDAGNNANGADWNFSNTANRVTETDNQFGGLCLQCHAKASIGPATNSAWKGMDRIHNTVKGWGTFGGNSGNAAHSFVCSKCHTPHNSRLPRLMVTNCLDYEHRGQVPSGATFGAGALSDSKGAGGGRGPMGGGGDGDAPDWPGPWFFAPASPSQSTSANIRTCHNVAGAGGTGTAAANELWNTKTPW